MSPRLRSMLRKELIQAFRDPRMRMVIFVVPVIQTLVFGYAVTMDVDHARIAISDLDRSPMSRELISTIAGCGLFELAETSGAGGVTDLLDMGRVDAVVMIPSGFGEFSGGEGASIQILTDGTGAVTSGVISGYLSIVIGSFITRQAEMELLRTGIDLPEPLVTLETVAWFNERLESRYFFVPGVIAMIVMIITLMLSSMAIAREKETGTIEQVMVTPLTRLEFILGKTLPFGIIGLIDVIVVTVIAVAWFGIPMRGSLLLLLAGAVVYLASTLGAGVLISTVSRTQQQAMLTVFFIIMPAVLLSGFTFPVENIPEPLRLITLANPVRHMLVILRGIFLKGVGFDVLWPQFAALALLGAAFTTLAMLRFRKTL